MRSLSNDGQSPKAAKHHHHILVITVNRLLEPRIDMFYAQHRLKGGEWEGLLACLKEIR